MRTVYILLCTESTFSTFHSREAAPVIVPRFIGCLTERTLPVSVADAERFSDAGAGQ